MEPSDLSLLLRWSIFLRGRSCGVAPCPRALGESVCLCGQQARPLSDCVVSGSVGWRPLEWMSLWRAGRGVCAFTFVPVVLKEGWRSLSKSMLFSHSAGLDVLRME